MQEERRKELALAIVEMQLVEQGIPGTGRGGVQRVAGQTAKSLKDLGFKTDTDELVALYQSFAPRILGRAFGFQKVHLEMSEKRSSTLVVDPRQ